MPDPPQQAKPITIGEFIAKISEFYPYGEEPPRLCAALNDARTDAPDGTLFDDTKGVPTEHHIEKPYDDKAIGSILKWISGRLDRSLMELWFTQIGCMSKWMDTSDAGVAEESWAQAVAEVFLGLTYSGPLQMYNMSAPLLPRLPDGRTMLRADTESWEQYIFRRIAQSYPRQFMRIEGNKAYGAYDLKSWEEPAPIEADPYEDEAEWAMHENKDPAISVGVACQHQTTYGALTRGIPLDWLGNASNPAVGFMASDACSGMPAFGDFGTPNMPSPYGGAKDLVKDPSPAGKWVKPTPSVLVLNNAIAEGFAPGSIVVLDPDSGAGVKSVDLYLSDYEKQSHVYRSVLKKYFFTRGKVGEGKFSDAMTNKDRKAPASEYVAEIDGKIALNDQKIERLNKEIAELNEKIANEKNQNEKFKAQEKLRTKQASLAEAQQKKKYLADQKTLASKDSTSVFTYKFNEQLPGSHIYFVLRVKADKKSWQAFDVSVGEGLGHLKTSGSEVILGRQGGGHIDGYKMTDIPPGDGKQFAGFGILPAISAADLLKSAAFLRSARPVGLCRLMISERGRTVGKKYYPGLADKNQILYVSRLVPMYGSKPDQNYTISKLLWSIRNTPGFSDLQCWWITFAPQGLLAKCMWAEGARGMTLRQFMDKFYTHEEWSYWSFFLSDYLPSFLDRSKPPEHELEKKRKKTVKKLFYNQQYLPVSVLTNEGDKAIAGKVAFVCRWNGGEGHETGKATPMDPPGAMTSLLKTLEWDQMYLHKDLEKYRQAIDDATPAFFKGEPEAEATTPEAS